MSKRTNLTILLLLGAMVLTAGCGAKKAKEPKKAIVNFYKALEEDDRELFMATIYVEEDDKEFAERLFDATSATIKLMKKLEEKYGREEVVKLRTGGGVAALTAETVEKQVKIKVEEDKATATMTDGRKLPPLVKKDGRWMVDMGLAALTGEAREKAEKWYKRMKEAADRAEEKIGKEGQTAEKIMSELEAEIAETAPPES